MITLRSQLYSLFRQRPEEWIPSGELQRMEFKNKKDGTVFTPQNVGRTLRKMETDKSIAVTYGGTKQAAKYKYLPTYLRPFYRTATERTYQNRVDIFTKTPEQIREIRAQARRQGYDI